MMTDAGAAGERDLRVSGNSSRLIGVRFHPGEKQFGEGEKEKAGKLFLVMHTHICERNEN